MNPPSALFSAMNRERKPFTYTPGGLDLSEIKSERMAKRLMRNAMNQGVPEVPIQQIQSPSTPSTPIAVPNFNCLPVQVFPTFNLPANPKSLLRTRSNPEHPKEPTKGVQSPSPFAVNNSKPSAIQTPQSSPFPLHLPSYVAQTNNVSQNRPASMYEYNNSANTIPRTNYESNGSTAPLLPPISYEAEYFQTPFKNNNGNSVSLPDKSENIKVTVPTKICDDSDQRIVQDEKLYTPLKSISVTQPESSKDNIVTVPLLNDDSHQLFVQDDKLRQLSESYNSISVNSIPEKWEDSTVTVPVTNKDSDPSLVYSEKLYSDFEIQPISNTSVPRESMPVEDEVTSDNEQKEVKVVKKQVKKEQKIENGEQNGNADVEAELVVKLPAKKSAAKTETKVEVHKTILPDGTVEEVKVTTTKTTIDGKTEIKTKTEKKVIPKEEVEEVEEEEEEEQEETSGTVQEVEEVVEEPEVVIKKTVKETPVVENGQKETIIKEKESVETSTTKKVVIVQKEESEEEEEEDEPEPVVVKKPVEKPPSPKPEVKKVENETEIKEVVSENEAEEEVEKEVEQEEVTVTVKKPEPPKQEEEGEEVEGEYEEADEEKVEKKQEKVETKVDESKEDDESEYTEEEYESEKEEAPVKEPEPKPKEIESNEPETETELKSEEKLQEPAVKPEPKEEKSEEPVSKPDPIPEQKVPLREPSIPLEKVEEVEIKPIGPASEVISKTHTENTEIITNTSQKPTGPLSTQTEYSRVENIVTVNRTTKALDHSYEQITQAGIPTVRTYFAPSRERIGPSPTPSRPYQPVYAPEPPTERRHSLLLDRLSTERQLPTSDIYQNTYQNTYNNQSYEQQRQWSQEPQSEILSVSNVKPSKITNSQWYQQNQRENVIYNNVTPSAGVPPPAPTPAPINQEWNQPTPQQQPQYQPSYIDSTAQERTLTNTYQPTNYPSYAPKPSNWANELPSVNTNQYSFVNKDINENYQKSTQQYSSSYVPPPWEQDSNYVAGNTNQNYYQPPPQSTTYTPGPNQGWKPTPPPNKFTKPPPTAYIPPAPNQSFVKSGNVVEPPRLPGRKTYYSEYERRYITVPESTYIPGETAKFQPQPDPSPQYYYDNNEPSEKVEHEWRKELREFTEKTTTQTTEQTSVKPPWEEENKYAKTPTSYTPTPTWSQTLRPRSWRERSFESEYVGSQELPKTNTLGRGRPLSTYAKAEAPTPDRARGVSVDRYNPNYYQSPIPAEHPPVRTHTLTPTPPAKVYHNPNVPAYHAHPHASAEPRDHPVPIPQARLWGSDARGSPVQSRSFKYLQWITGTED